MLLVLPSQVHPSYPYGNPTHVKHPASLPRRPYDPSSRALFEDMGYAGGGVNGSLRWKDLALDLLLPVDEEKEEAPVEDETSAAQAFHDMVKEKAALGAVSGSMIINFEEVLVLTPRGRYDVDMFPDFLRLRGKTYDYKISYDGIQKLFLLPKDDQHVLFIVSCLCLL